MKLATAALLALVACGHETESTPQQAAPAHPSAAFGDALTVKEATSLSDIVKNPAAYKGKTLATEGKVTKVCQERGCWMGIQDASGTATVRMHGHAFFVPTTSSGKHARVQGTVMLTKDGKECDEMEAVGAQLEIDATGVELD